MGKSKDEVKTNMIFTREKMYFINFIKEFMLNLEKKHIALGLAFAALVGCSSKSSGGGGGGGAPLMSNEAVSDAVLGSGDNAMTVAELNSALSSGNRLGNFNSNVEFTAEMSNDVLTFKFDNKESEDDDRINVEFKDFTEEGGVLTSTKTSPTETIHGYCKPDNNDCTEGRNKEEAQNLYAKDELDNDDATWADLSNEQKSDFNDWWGTGSDLHQVTVDVTNTTSLRFFGKTLPGLSYSNFGLVQRVQKETGSFNSESINDSYYFGYGDVSKKEQLASDTTFKGNAFATVSYYIEDDDHEEYKAQNIKGNAELRVDGSGNKNLDVALNNYYILKYTNGNYDTRTGSNGLGAKFDIGTNNVGGSADYQGYGAVSDNPTEVVGVFNVNHNDPSQDRNVWIDGSFGALKQP
ncbi:MAG: hypothetical protein Ta2D_11690 [Rickettsiales bacterium]|nr:MAG: hypothetical protein Ta2D_11690 [Rickettsiales bacterium]